MDEYAKAIHELCDKHYHDNISESVRNLIENNLMQTKQIESAAKEIVNRLTVESRIKIIGDFMGLADLMNEKIIPISENIILILIAFRDSDRVLGSFLENRQTAEQKRKITEVLVYELNFEKKLREEEYPSSEKIDEQIKRLTDKNVFSYQTLLELTIGARRAQVADEIEFRKLFERMIILVTLTINSFKLYRT